MRSELAAAPLEKLTQAVSDAVDREEIRALTAAYNHTFDDVDVDGWLATFTDDAEFVIVGGATLRGDEELRAFHVASGFGRVHVTGDNTITVSGDEATQVCSLILGERVRGGAAGTVSFVNTGRYEDLLRRTPQGWRFARRVFSPDAEIAP